MIAEAKSGPAPQNPFDIAALDAYLREHIAGFEGPIQLTRFKGGQSNPTYLLGTPQRQYVMRCKPGPVAQLLPSAHAVEREFRLQASRMRCAFSGVVVNGFSVMASQPASSARTM